jgi:hypothetical protein
MCWRASWAKATSTSVGATPPIEGVALLSLSVRLGLEATFGSCFHFSASGLWVDEGFFCNVKSKLPR